MLSSVATACEEATSVQLLSICPKGVQNGGGGKGALRPGRHFFYGTAAIPSRSTTEKNSGSTGNTCRRVSNREALCSIL